MKHRSLAALGAMILLAGCGSAADQGAPEAAAPETPVSVKAPAGTYVLDPTHASLQWSLVHLGISNYTARFNTFEAQLTLDPADLSTAKVTASIDPTSVDANYPGDYKVSHATSAFADWNDDIANNPTFLNARAFPRITFTSTKVEPTGPRTADVIGDLSFLGQTRPVTLKATFVGELESHPFLQVPAVGFSAEGTFKRSEFGMTVSPGVGDDITIAFDGEFVRQTAPAAAN